MIRFLYLVFALFLFTSSCNSEKENNYDKKENIPQETITHENITNENITYENIIHENITHENITYENITYENIIHEIITFENIISENITVEDIDISYTSIDDFQDNFDNCYSSESLNYDIDWDFVLGRFAVGSSIIIGTGVLSFISSSVGQQHLAFVFATSSKEALREALIGASMAGSLNTIVEVIKNGGSVSNYIEKTLIEGAADGFMLGAISGASLGIVKSVNLLYKGVILDDFGHLIGIKDEFGRLLDDFGNVKGNILYNGFIEDNANKIIGKLDDAGNFIKNYESYIPKNNLITTKNGSQIRFQIFNKEVYRLNGTYVGTIDDAGRIIKDGKLVGAVDESGKLIPSIRESINKDVILNPDLTVANLTDFDIKPATKNGRRNLFTKEGNIAGQIDENNKIITNWREELTKARQLAVKNAKKCIFQNGFSYTEALKNGAVHPSVTENEYKAFLESGGKGLDGHHIKNVANNPNYANRSDNIVFVGREAHKQLHNGNFRNPSKGNFTKLKCRL